MTSRRDLLAAAPAAGALFAAGAAAFTVPTVAHAQQAGPSGPSWHSASLTTETVTGPNGAVTTPTALSVNERLGASELKHAERVATGVYALRGWGIAHSFAIEAPNGWIIIDTGDFTQVASEMRETLEKAIGQRIKVAATICLLLAHYADRHRRVAATKAPKSRARAPGPRPKGIRRC